MEARPPDPILAELRAIRREYVRLPTRRPAETTPEIGGSATRFSTGS